MPDEKRPDEVGKNTDVGHARKAPRVERIPDSAPTAETRLEITREIHRGALPHPEAWERYEAAVPGTGLRLLRLVDNEQAQRWAFRRRGQWMGFIVALYFGGASVWLISEGKNTQALVYVIVAITPIIGGFLGRILRAVESKLLEKMGAEHSEGD